MRDILIKIADRVGDNFVTVFPNVKIIKDMVGKYIFNRADGEVPIEFFKPGKYLFLNFDIKKYGDNLKSKLFSFS